MLFISNHVGCFECKKFDGKTTTTETKKKLQNLFQSGVVILSGLNLFYFYNNIDSTSEFQLEFKMHKSIPQLYENLLCCRLYWCINLLLSLFGTLNLT